MPMYINGALLTNLDDLPDGACIVCGKHIRDCFKDPECGGEVTGSTAEWYFATEWEAQFDEPWPPKFLNKP